MGDEVYYRLAKVLDTLPNGFPSTESGIEIKLLRRIFEPEQADLFCDLRLSFETAEQIAERTGRPLEGLKEKLLEMGKRGQIQAIPLGDTVLFRMLPWVFGIYEMQLPHLDREFVEMVEEYYPIFGQQFFTNKPQQFQIIPVEKEIPNKQEALPYEQVSSIIENSQSFVVFDCICKKEKRLLDKGCEKPPQICTAYAPIPGAFENFPLGGRVISKEEAYEVLNKAEEAGLVHLTSNVAGGHFFICNCCGCCCGVLGAINDLGLNASDVINSHYYAVIDPDKCVACGTCANERCQVKAIEEGEDYYWVIREKCIGCGLCVSTCSSEAIQLLHKRPEEIVPPPKDEMSWFEERARLRGVDMSAYK